MPRRHYPLPRSAPQADPSLSLTVAAIVIAEMVFLGVVAVVLG